MRKLRNHARRGLLAVIVSLGLGLGAMADVPPPPDVERRSVTNTLKVHSSPGYHYFLVSFSDPVFKTNRFELRVFDHAQTMEVELLNLLGPPAAPPQGHSPRTTHPSNHAHILGLSVAEQRDLAQQLLTHPKYRDSAPKPSSATTPDQWLRKHAISLSNTPYSKKTQEILNFCMQRARNPDAVLRAWYYTRKDAKPTPQHHHYEARIKNGTLVVAHTQPPNPTPNPKPKP